MRRAGGFTIIQIMAFLFVVGIVGWAIVNAIIDKRCEADPSRSLCANRTTTHAK